MSARNIYLGHGEWIDDSPEGREYLANLVRVNQELGGQLSANRYPTEEELIANAACGCEQGDFEMVPSTMEQIVNARKKEEDDDEDDEDDDEDLEDNEDQSMAPPSVVRHGKRGMDREQQRRLGLM